MNTTVNKAVVSILGGAVTVAAMFFPGIAAYATEPVIGAVGALLTSLLVYAIPNKQA